MDEQPTSEIPATLSRGTTMAVSTETFLATTRNLEVELEIVAMARSQGVTAANPIVQLTHATHILLILQAISSFTFQNSETQCQFESFPSSVQKLPSPPHIATYQPSWHTPREN